MVNFSKGRTAIFPQTCSGLSAFGTFVLLYGVLLYGVLLFGFSGFAFAQEKTGSIEFPKNTDLNHVQSQCAKRVIIIKTDKIICEAQKTKKPDSLSAIIADMQRIKLESNPIDAGQEGDREALRHLPDVSPKAALRLANELKELRKRTLALDTQNLSSDDKLNHQLLLFVLNQDLMLSNFDTARIPFTNDSGFFNMLSYVSRQTSFSSIDDYEAYAARLSELPRFFSQHKDNMRRGIKTNFTASAQILPGIIEMVEKLGQGEAVNHSYYAPFKSFPDLITKDEQKKLSLLGEQAINDYVLPAYRDLAIFLRNEYLPHARRTAGIGQSDEARQYYKALVRYFTTLDISPDEVHELGLKEVERIRGEMDEIIKQAGFQGSFKEFLHFLRTDEQFYAKTPEDLLKQASWISKRIDGKMPQFFSRLPRLPYGVMAVPEEIAPNYTTGRYWGGNLKQGKAGFFVVNTYDLKQRPLYNLPALALHEGVPGHHHQISLAQEMQNVPKFRQSLYPGAFGEGWGLYSEKLGVEMGIYQTPYENFGRLTYEMWRACRLVVDTGMHWKNWSREQAEQCFLENSALSAHNIKTEVDRYISWPGQALSYKIGELKILELRKKAEQELGLKFDIRKFHDEVLGAGGIPLNILEARIDDWIAKERVTQ